MDWFVWNGKLMIGYLMAALLVWLLSQIKQAEKKIKHPRLLGLAVCIVSGFDLALGASVVIFLYLFLTWTIENWLKVIINKSKTRNN